MGAVMRLFLHRLLSVYIHSLAKQTFCHYCYQSVSHSFGEICFFLRYINIFTPARRKSPKKEKEYIGEEESEDEGKERKFE